MADGKKQIKFIILPLIASLLLLGQNLAFAEIHPYIASYPTLSKTAVVEIWQRNNWAGTTPGSLTYWTASVVSTAEQQSDGTLTGWIAQQANLVGWQAGYITTQAMILKPGGTPFDCVGLGVCPTLGTFSQINYVLQDMYWSSDGSSITFYWNAIYNDNTQHSGSATYTKGTGDNNRYFVVGNETDGTTHVKFVQVGVESAGSTANWQTKQWGGGYKVSGGSDTYFSSYSDYELDGNGGDTYGSDITYYSCGTNCTTYVIVGDTYYSANADYPLKPGSTLQAGEVVWYYSLTKITAGTKLWG